MLRLMFEACGTDTTISQHTFSVHYGFQRGRSASGYYRRLAPPAVSAILSKAAVTSVIERCVLGIPGESVPVAGDFPEWEHKAKLVWVLPDEHQVRVLVRNAIEPLGAPFRRDVPASGSLAIPEPATAPLRACPAYVEFSDPRTCPRCEHASVRYRQVAGALICLRCSRSFTAPASWNAAVCTDG